MQYVSIFLQSFILGLMLRLAYEDTFKRKSDD